MTSTSRTPIQATNVPSTHPHHVSPLPLYMALVGTFLLRFGGGVMGILIGLYLAAKDTEMRGGLFGHLVSSTFSHSALSGLIVKMTPNPSYVIPATLVGIITASYFITELGGSFISGSLIDRHGPKRYMIFGPMFGAIAVFITAILHLTGDSTVLQFALFLGLLFATRLLEGASGATTNPATLAYIAAYTDGEPKLRSRVSGYFEICTLIGAGVGFVFGGVLWRELGQTGFLVNAGVYALSAVVFFVGVRNITNKGTATHTESHNLKAYLRLVRTPRLRELVPTWLAVSGLLGILFNHTTFQLSNGAGGRGDGLDRFAPFPGQTLSHAFNGSQVGLVFGLYAIAFGLGIVIWTGFIPRMRKSTAMMIAAVGIVTSSIFIAAINHTGPIGETNWLRLPLIILMFLAVMVESGFTPAALVYLSDLSELHAESRGMVMGLYSFLLGFGQVIGSVVGGPFADKAGVDGLLLLMALLGMASFAGVLLLRRDELISHEGLTPKTKPTGNAISESAAD